MQKDSDINTLTRRDFIRDTSIMGAGLAGVLSVGKPLTYMVETMGNKVSFVENGDHEWLKTARVALFDGHMYPLHPRCVFDAEIFAETLADMHFNAVRLAAMGKYSFIQGIRFTTHPDIGQRDILTEAVTACKARGIRVVPYVSTGNRIAETMLKRDYPEYAHRQTPGGEPKSHNNFTGERRSTVCWSSPYRDAYLDFIEHLINNYGISGLYFDAWLFAWYGYSPPYTCYCKWCQEGFRKASGKDIPYRENHEGSAM